MGHRRHRGCGAGANVTEADEAQAQTPLRFARPDRRLLLAGTALATALLFSGVTPAHAQRAITIPLSFTPVIVNNSNDCIFPGNCAFIHTAGLGAFIDLTNSGNFATAAPLSLIHISEPTRPY